MTPMTEEAAQVRSANGVPEADRPRRKPNGLAGRRPGPIVYVLLTALSIFALGPILLTLFNALKTQSEMARDPIGLPPTWQWDNFLTAWQQANMGAGLVNSAIVVGGTVIGCCFISGCAAYALARLEIKGASPFITYLLISSSLPLQMFLVPLFYMWSELGLYDTLLGLILIYCAVFSPFLTLLLRSFLIPLPKEIEEAARIDGAGELRVLLNVVLPSALPGLLTVALIGGLSAYNEFLFAVTFIQDSSLLPVSMSFFSFQRSFTQDFTLMSAAGLIMIAPMLILFLILQRRFIAGLSASGMGGG
jgi:raffinose/stachyose/melibiose transport system permease protein